VCEAANKRAIQLMNAKGLEAATLVLDVQTGALVAFAARSGSNASGKGTEPLKVTPPVLCLSPNYFLSHPGGIAVCPTAVLIAFGAPRRTRLNR